MMRKFYFLFLTLLVTSLSFGQNLAVNGGFESWAAGALDGGWDVVDFSTTDLTENTAATFITEGSSSASVMLMTTSQGSTDIRQTVATTPGTVYTVSMDVYATDNQARVRLFGDGFTPSEYSDDTILNTWQTVTFDYTATGAIFEVGIRFYDTAANWTGNGSQFYIDNVQIVAQTGPSLAITAPTDGSTVTTPDVDVELVVQSFTVANGSGDGHISYTVDGGPAILKYDTAPINLVGLASGSHTVAMELVDNSGAPLNPAVTASVTFTVSGVTQVADITALRAGTVGDFYELTGEALISYIVTDNTRNQKYIQDGTAGILIDDDAGILTGTFNIGDGVSGLTGQLGEFAGTLQFIPSADVTASSTGNVVTPQVMDLATYLASPEDHESELISISDVTFPAADGTAVFADNTNYDIVKDANTGIMRVSFGDEDLIGTLIEAAPAIVTGLGGQFNSEYQVLARYASDIDFSTLSTNNIVANTTTFSLYPNPTNTGFVNIKTSSNEAITVSVYNVLGKQVINTTLNNTPLNVSSLNAGIYIVNINQNGNTTTKKLVVK
ncbi:MAG: T9SS type A sorting domain-containing protein [Bizionia sp.]|nr:T9SS type A sorting domain-containing protein [Bizionia sp.]